MRFTPGRCCCGGSDCKLFDFSDALASPVLTDYFDVVSGTWSINGSTQLIETSGSGIVLAKGVTFDDLKQIVIVTSGDFDIVFDYVDSSNYMVVKDVNTTPTIAEVVSGVETNLTAYRTDAFGTPSGSSMLSMDGSNLWTVCRQGGRYDRVYRNESLVGGTRCGIRSRYSGSGVVTDYIVCSTATNDLSADRDFNTTVGGESIASDPASGRDFCAILTDDVRCSECTHLSPTVLDDTWQITVSGVTGSCASIYNGVFVPTNKGFGKWNCVRHYSGSSCSMVIPGQNAFPDTYSMLLLGRTDTGVFGSSGGNPQGMVQCHAIGSLGVILIWSANPSTARPGPVNCHNYDFSGSMDIDYSVSANSYADFSSMTVSLSIT